MRLLCGVSDVQHHAINALEQCCAEDAQVREVTTSIGCFHYCHTHLAQVQFSSCVQEFLTFDDAFAVHCSSGTDSKDFLFAHRHTRGMGFVYAIGSLLLVVAVFAKRRGIFKHSKIWGQTVFGRSGKTSTRLQHSEEDGRVYRCTGHSKTELKYV